ncbi:MAG: hypothetical protein HYZ20_03145 [Burkholderiales bacterium]|nr:hypothetical protein [Burkholderiales bacterium]
MPFILDCSPALVNDRLVRLALELAAQCGQANPPDASGAARMSHIANCARQRLSERKGGVGGGIEGPAE